MSFTKIIGHYVICNMCGENLGKYREYYAEEHMKKYPDHKSHMIINVYENQNKGSVNLPGH